MMKRGPLIRFILLLPFSALPAQLISENRPSGAQPPGIKPEIYNCTYPETRLSLNVSGSMVDCGSVDGKYHVFNVKDITTRPGILLGGAHPERLYAAFLLNPINKLLSSFVSPILHAADGNIPGSSLVNGKFGAADTIYEFHPPAPPIPFQDCYFVYLVFLQPSQEPIDWSNVTKLSVTKYPIEAVASEKNLSLVASNYFTVQKW